MVDITLQKMNESLESSGDFLSDMANGARRFVCKSYKKVPGALAGSPLDNPVSQAFDGLLRTLCDPLPDSTPDSSEPVPGGQCEGRLYTINWRSKADASADWVTGFGFSRYAPIGGILLEQAGEDSLAIVLISGGTTSPVPGTREIIGFVSGEPGNQGSAQLLSVVPLDGLPDNCGDVPPNYPIVPADIGDVKGEEGFTIGGRNFKLPIEISPVKVEVGVQFKPEINVNIGGIQVNLEFAGAKINISPTFNFNPVLPPALDPREPKPTPVLPPIPPDNANRRILDKVNEIDTDLERIEDLLREVKECACEDEPETSLVSYGLGLAASGDEFLIPQTRIVKLVLVDRPVNERRQEGLSAPDVVYAGWGWYKYLGGMSERLPIDAAEKTFPVPEGIEPNRFCWTCQTGFTAQVTAYYEAEEGGG